MLTRQSAETIGACLDALQDCREVIVQDGGSTDGTRAIVATYPQARFLDQNPKFLDENGRISDFSAVRNEGIMHAQYDWIFVVDSNEVMTPEMMNEVRSLVAGPPCVYQAFRRFYVRGERIEWCAGYPAVQIRLFHRSCVIGYTKTVHEKLVLKEGVVPHLLITELPEIVPSYAVTLRKNAYYRLLERRRLGVLSWKRWFFEIALRNLRSVLGLFSISLWLWITPRKGKRMPLQYEWAYIRQQLLLIIDLFPYLAYQRGVSTRS